MGGGGAGGGGPAIGGAGGGIGGGGGGGGGANMGGTETSIVGLIEAGTQSATSLLRCVRSPRRPEEHVDVFKARRTSATRSHGNLVAARADSPLLLNLIPVLKSNRRRLSITLLSELK